VEAKGWLSGRCPKSAAAKVCAGQPVPPRGRLAGPSEGQAWALDLTKRSPLLYQRAEIWLLENHRLPIVVADVSVRHVRMLEPADNWRGHAGGHLLTEERHAQSEEIARLIEDTGVR